MAGQRFGKFEVLGELGRGGQGAVLRARDPAGRLVALKLLLRADPKHERRFRQEAQVLAALQHPGVVRVVDAGVEGGVPWLAMALVEGESLRARLDRTGPLPPKDAARLVAALARAVGHCHARGIVHRDLKPENVLLERATGAPVLVDFGLIRRDAEVFGDLSIDARSRLSTTGELRGTPAYMAPEQVNPGRWGPVSPATDVYGLGGILCTLLTDEPPHVAGSLPALMVSILEGNVPNILERRPDCPKAIAAVCLTALQPAPAARWPSAEAFAAALEAGAAGRPVTAPGARSRARLALGLVAAAVVVLGGVGAGVAVALRPSVEAVAPARPAPTSATAPEPAPAPVEPAPAPPFALVPLGEARVGALIHGLAVAPDGERVALATKDGRVLLLRASGEVAWEAKVGGEPKTLAFRQDGQRLYVAGHHTAIRALDVEAGVEVAAHGDSRQVTWCLTATPDGLYAAVGDRPDATTVSQVRLLDLETLRNAALPLAARDVGQLARVGQRGLLGVAARPASRPSDSALYLFDPPRGQTAVRSRGVADLAAPPGRISLGACAHLPGPDLAVATVRNRRGLFLWDLEGDRVSVVDDPDVPDDGTEGRGCASLTVVGDLVVTTTFDGALLAWRVAGRGVTFAGRLEGAHRGMALALGATSRGVVSAGQDGVVRWWGLGPSAPQRAPAVATGSPRFAPEPRAELQVGPTVWSVAPSPDGARLAVGTDDGRVLLLGPGRERVWERRGLGRDVKWLAFRPDGRRLYSAGHAAPISALELERGETTATFGEPDQDTWGLLAARDRLYATVGNTPVANAPARVLVLDPETLRAVDEPLAAPEVERLVPARPGELLGVAARPASRPSDSALYLFEPARRRDAVQARSVKELPEGLGRVSLGACAYLPDLELGVAAVRNRRGLLVWSLRSDKLLLADDPEVSFDGKDGRGCACLAVAGHLVICGTYDGALVAWELDGRRATFAGRLEGVHTRAVLAVAKTPEGVVSAGQDGVVRWWSLTR